MSEKTTTDEPRELSEAELEQRRTNAAALTRHGAKSTLALAPAVVSMKKSLLARMGLRQRDLTWAGRELLDSYCRAKAKVAAIDAWLEKGNPLIDAEGRPPDVMRLYFVALNASTRNLDALRGVIADMSREDTNLAAALAALDAEEAKAKR
jgi:hypothetical protein